MSGKKKIVEKKVYKANTKAIIWLVVVIILITFGLFGVKPLKRGITLLYFNTWETHTNSEYHFEFSLPRAYQEVVVPERSSSIASSIFTTDTEVQVNEKYVSQLSEIVYSGGNRLNGISMTIQALKTEKTSKSLDEIAEGQHILVLLNFENNGFTVGEMQKEYVSVLNTEAIKVSETLTKKDEIKDMIVSYLIPLTEEEITIIFYGNREEMGKATEEMEKIVEGMKLL